MYQNNLSAFNSFYSLAEVEVGKHLYWEIAGLKLHGQVFIVSWLVMGALLAFAVAGTRDLKQTPEGLQNFMEYAYEFLQDIAENQIRKSTRLNSSHTVISYAVFCLKKKKKKNNIIS